MNGPPEQSVSNISETSYYSSLWRHAMRSTMQMPGLKRFHLLPLLATSKTADFC